MAIRISSFLLITVLFVSPGFAQFSKEWDLKISNTTYISSDTRLPFWFHSNTFGIIEQNSANNIFSFEAEKNFSGGSTFDYRLKATPVARISKSSNLFFNELFAEVKAGYIHLYAGKKKWKDGIWQSGLSLGSMVWSGNAATIPKVMLSLPEYISIPFTKDFLAFRGYIGHGWFSDDRYVSDTYLHEKAFYLRFMPKECWLNGHIGVIHNVQWGGVHPAVGTLPRGLDDLGRIFLGESADPHQSPGGEVVNALGNTVGAYEAKLDLDFEQLQVTAYRQFFIETSVSSKIRSPWDGLWGVELKLVEDESGWITHILWEHVNTKRQNAQPGEEIGADQYYANYLYRSGWTYKNRVIGLPLAYTDDVNGVNQVVNNIIIAHHIGLKGTVPVNISGRSSLSYKLTATYSRNYGRTTSCSGDFCDEGEFNPLRTPRNDELYTRLNFRYSLNESVNIWSGIGADFGALYDAVGIYFGASYALF